MDGKDETRKEAIFIGQEMPEEVDSVVKVKVESEVVESRVNEYSFETVSIATAPDELVHEQAKKLFKLCDQESRGFVVKIDLEHLNEFLSPYDVEQLENRIEKTPQKFFDETQFLKVLATLFSNGESSLADELAVLEIGNEINEKVDEKKRDEKPMDRFQSAPLISPSDEISVDTLVQNYVQSHPLVESSNSKFRPGPPTDEMNPMGQSLADELSEAGVQSSSRIPPELEMRVPDRIFKVVFVGDSAVGKTCFLHRFCHNRFKPLFNATIGVDFTVKTIQLKDRLIAVQLWDTAGQERFRSITKQYFRKADGVVLMYDVTSEQSFLHVRNWIDSVRAGVDDNVVMCLVGNKVDLFASEQQRELTRKAGRQIAEEFGMLFHETSAYTGFGINECMMAMATRLQKREDDHLEEALRLEMEVTNRKSWCCL
ncbi:unnamed protein product, partial [Mesorhabditis belari]|uniref:EF-hand domain-containing protein n=1 Tax=Mesorhabditis belari TaxID=2138241 RepID=A0AAF3EPJ9_9BILA